LTGIWYWHTHSSPITNLLAYLGIIALATTPLGLPTVFWILFKRAKRRATAAGIRAETFKPIEQLAAIDVLCASPTGIFTEPFFSLTAADCTGHTLNAEISLNNGNPQLLPGDPRKHHPRATHALLLSVGALCNNASLEHSIQAAEDYIAYGEPDEGALLVMAGRLGLWKARLDRLFPRLMEAPFSVERGRMSSLHEARLTPHLSEAELPLTGILRSRRSYLVAAKGDFSSILEICSRIWVEGKSIPLDSEWRKKVSLQAEELAGQGGRIIGVAIRQLPRLPALVEDYQLPLQGFPEHLKDIPRSKKDIPLAPEAAEEFERDMILTGMIVLSIDPHPEAQTSVEACQREGLQLIMMTRTNPSQARETSLNLHMNPNQVASVCEGKRLAQNSGSAGREMLLRANVWTQFTPQQRVLAIQILQENGRRVAYTGQDASDRPAMQQADVGIQLPGPNPSIAPIPGSLVMFTPGLRSIYEGIITARESVAGCRRAYVISGLVSLALLGWIVAMWIRSGGYKLPSPGMLGIFLGLGLAVEIGVGIGKKSRSRVED
jgi:Ca2+-transporting ATPase